MKAKVVFALLVLTGFVFFFWPSEFPKSIYYDDRSFELYKKVVQAGTANLFYSTDPDGKSQDLISMVISEVDANKEFKDKVWQHQMKSLNLKPLEGNKSELYGISNLTGGGVSWVSTGIEITVKDFSGYVVYSYSVSQGLDKAKAKKGHREHVFKLKALSSQF